jgi:Ca2+-binding RTX toxin-like protein
VLSIPADGTISEYYQSVLGSAIAQIIVELPAIIAGTKTLGQVLNGINTANVAGSFIGAKLASAIVSFDSIGGQIGGSVGSAVGAAILAKVFAAEFAKLGAFAGPVGAAVGAFVGFILGGAIGSIFGGTPRSSAEVIWDPEQQRFEVANAHTIANTTATGTATIIDASDTGAYAMIDDITVNEITGSATFTVSLNKPTTTAGSISWTTSDRSGYQIDVAAVIDGGAGDDTIRGGDLGNDLLGGAGNDTLVGGKLDDWILGGDNDDRMFAGSVSNAIVSRYLCAITTQRLHAANDDLDFHIWGEVA